MEIKNYRNISQFIVNRDQIFIIISFLSMVILQIFIQPLTADYDEYVSFFRAVEPINLIIRGVSNNFFHHITSFELGYKILNSVFKFFINNYLYFFFLYNVLILVILYKFVIKNSKRFFVIILPYFSIMYIAFQLGIIRQAMASVIFYISIEFLIKRKFFKYIILILIAFLFHRVSVILIPLYFLFHKRVSILFISIFYLLLIVLYLLKFDVLSSIPSWIYIDDAIKFKVEYYMKNAIPNNYLGIGFWDRIITFFLLVKARTFLEKSNNYDDFTNVSFNLAVFNISMQMFFFNYPLFTTRIRYFFIIFSFFVFSKAMDQMKNNSNIFIYKCIIAFYCLMMFMFRVSFI